MSTDSWKLTINSVSICEAVVDRGENFHLSGAVCFAIRLFGLCLSICYASGCHIPIHGEHFLRRFQMHTRRVLSLSDSRIGTPWGAEILFSLLCWWRIVGGVSLLRLGSILEIALLMRRSIHGKIQKWKYGGNNTRASVASLTRPISGKHVGSSLETLFSPLNALVD